MAPKTQKLNQKEAAAKTQQSKCNEVNRGKDDNINNNELKRIRLIRKFSNNREESLEISDDDNNDNNDVFFYKEKTHSLTTSEAITSPRTRRTSSLVPKATTPIRAGRIAFLVPDVVTSP
ncbi:unnamed protein product [Rhizophagus irregularis]|uniref:Uncharacterized protein n=1 Tax=Rhizophagus irregularis TaxID=588596 RepID=A0A915Z6E7_9GLOM|nr:unnamed protein product [Rhizophagus irregularis]CAB5185757.1 unnamed protein product [Rhizophagus irregularis]CAB5364590.1 unnamed protein product [Rhizophagus irregularis]